MFNFKGNTASTMLAASILIVIPVVQASAADKCTVSSIQLVDASPGTVNSDGSVNAGDAVTVRGSITESGTSSPGCAAGTGGAAVSEGTLIVQGQIQDTVPVSCKPTGVGSFSDLASRSLPNTNPPGANIVAHTLDTTLLGGLTRGYRTAYNKLTPHGSYKSSTSVCVDLTVHEVSSSVCDPYGDEVVLFIVGGAGQGQVAPGGVGPWAYTFKALNCTGVNDLAVKVQGGTSGWTVFKSVATAPILEPVNVVDKSNGKKGTTSTVTWNTVLNDEQSKEITVEVDGMIPWGAWSGQWMNLSGEWSAAYNDGNSATCNNISPKTGTCNPNQATPDKSTYTPQVYVEVVSP